MKFWKILFFTTLCLLFSSGTLLSWQDKKQKFLDFLGEYLNLNDDLQSTSNQEHSGVEPIIFKPIPIHYVHPIPVPVENFPMIDNFPRQLPIPIEISHEYNVQRGRPTGPSSSSISSSSKSKSRKHRKLSKHGHHNQNQYPGPPPPPSSSASASSSSIPLPLQCNLNGFQMYDM